MIEVGESKTCLCLVRHQKGYFFFFFFSLLQIYKTDKEMEVRARKGTDSEEFYFEISLLSEGFPTESPRLCPSFSPLCVNTPGWESMVLILPWAPGFRLVRCQPTVLPQYCLKVPPDKPWSSESFSLGAKNKSKAAKASFSELNSPVGDENAQCSNYCYLWGTRKTLISRAHSYTNTSISYSPRRGNFTSCFGSWMKR